jgi:ubiquinone/menaquinone biosynthesis C-methylase UbiE
MTPPPAPLPAPMSITRRMLLRAFGRPQGVLGRLGGLIMAHTNRDCAAWVIGLLGIQPGDAVLEIGFGPGVGIAILADTTLAGHIAGVDPSAEMIDQATARNPAAVAHGRVELRRGSAVALPFGDASFDQAFAINSMQVWPDAMAGLAQMRRVVKSGGKVALAFTPHSGQAKAGLIETLTAAGFVGARMVETENFCVLATKP